MNYDLQSIHHSIESDTLDLSEQVTELNRDSSARACPRTAILLHNCLAKEECQTLIHRTEQKGYEAALVNVGGGSQVAMTDLRNSDRCIIDDPEFAEMLYQRILSKLKGHPDVLQTMINWKQKNAQYAVGLNERLRVLRYDVGCYFKPHCDGSFVRGVEAGLDRQEEESEMTLLLYLNEDYRGGHTRFLHSRYRYDKDAGMDIVPRTGSVLLFEHDCFHESATLEAGRKYVLRTDVMYTRKGPGHEYSNGLYQKDSHCL